MGAIGSGAIRSVLCPELGIGPDFFGVFFLIS
jgi:hypothetical protein